METPIVKFIKKLFLNKNFAYIFTSSLFSVFVVLAIFFGIMWHYRVNLLNYLTNNGYFSSQSIKTNSSANGEVVNAVKKANPAVVSIVIMKKVPKYEAISDNSGDIFSNFLLRQNGIEEQEVGGGSGFFVSADGLMITNKHVVDQKNATYVVYTNDGEKHDARIVALDPVLDIAFMKVNGFNFPHLNLGNSDSLQVGQSVISIGNAFGEFRNSVSVGVVSGLARSVATGDADGNVELLDHVIQTDAAINPGNSGGPLLDLNGEVIGVNVAIVQDSQNIGFSLPINTIKSSLLSVQTLGKIIRPYLGIRYVPIDAEIKAENNLSVDYGVWIKAGSGNGAVVPGSPADKAGIKENDIVLEIDGIKLDQNVSLSSIIREKTIGSTVMLKILRQKVEKIIKVKLEAAGD